MFDTSTFVENFPKSQHKQSVLPAVGAYLPFVHRVYPSELVSLVACDTVPKGQALHILPIKIEIVQGAL